MRARHADACVCRSRPCVCRAWGAILKREGLDHLDYDCGDDVVVGNRGAGKLKSEEAAARRADTERYRTWAGDVLRRHRFPRMGDRRVWELHAAGIGTPTIAARLGVDRNAVRDSIAETKAAVRSVRAVRSMSARAIRNNLKIADPAILTALLRAATRAHAK